MRAWSQSQQKEIDIPDKQIMGGADTTSQYSTRDTLEKLRPALLMAALADPKNASKYGSILNLAKPTAYEAAQIKEQKETVGATQSLKALKGKVGKIRGIKDYLLYNGSRRIVSQTVTNLFERGRITNEDREFYMSTMPTWWQAAYFPDVAKAQIDNIEKDLKNKVNTSTLEEEVESGEQTGDIFEEAGY